MNSASTFHTAQTRIAILQFFLAISLLNTHLYSQLRGVNTISRIQFYEINSIPLFPTLITYSHKSIPDLLYYDAQSTTLRIAKNNGKGKFDDFRIISKTKPFDFISTANINNDGVDDFVIVRREENTIEVFYSQKNDSLYNSKKYSVSFYPEQVLLTDINNDKILDIICIGKLSSGVTVLLGKKDFSFREPQIIFPTIPVSSIIIVKFNGDAFPDVLIHNWLTNEELIYLGLGNLKYSLQSTMKFQNDTTKILAWDFTNDGLIDLAIASYQNSTLQIYEGDGLGGFRSFQSIGIMSLPDKLYKASFQKTTSGDLLLSSAERGSFSIISHRTDTYFNEEILFGCEEGEGELLAGDIDGDGLSDIVRFTRSTKYTVFWNSATSFTDDTTLTKYYAVGKNPVAIHIGDYDSDGKTDIAVANMNSSTISVLLNSKTENLTLRASFETAEKPISLSWYAQTDSTLTFLMRHQNALKVSVIEIHTSTDSNLSLYNDIISYSIPLKERATSLLPDVNLSQFGINFFVTNLVNSNTITYFQQVKSTRFVSKNLVPLGPSKIISATISDLNNDQRTDLLYLAYDEMQKKYFLGVTLNDANAEFKGETNILPLVENNVKKGFLLCEDITGDAVKDYIVFVSPSNSLTSINGKSLSKYSHPVIIDTGIEIFSQNDIQIFDYDNDGIYDIICANRLTSELLLYRGKGNGTFFNREKILDLPMESFFRCGDFNNDGVTDVTFTFPNKYYIAVKYGVQ